MLVQPGKAGLQSGESASLDDCPQSRELPLESDDPRVDARRRHCLQQGFRRQLMQANLHIHPLLNYSGEDGWKVEQQRVKDDVKNIRPVGTVTSVDDNSMKVALKSSSGDRTYVITGTTRVDPAANGSAKQVTLPPVIGRPIDEASKILSDSGFKVTEDPVANAAFAPGMHEVAAVITYLTPGLRFFHQGQFEGRKKRISPHLVRAPEEPVDKTLEHFYERLLAVLRSSGVRDGEWRLHDCAPAWDGNWTSDGFIAWSWTGADGQRQLIAVNYAPSPSQCYVRLPYRELTGRTARLKDLMSDVSYERDGSEVASRGLYLDLPPWGYHVFELTLW
jgi:hypothetical protein